MDGFLDDTSATLRRVLRGRPVQIVALAQDSPPTAFSNGEAATPVQERFVLLEDALRDVVSRPELRGLRVMVLSVAGAFQQGKSFLLNFILRFLQYAEQKQQANPKWMPEASDDCWFGDLTAPLEGAPRSSVVLLTLTPCVRTSAPYRRFTRNFGLFTFLNMFSRFKTLFYKNS